MGCSRGDEDFLVVFFVFELEKRIRYFLLLWYTVKIQIKLSHFS